MSGQLILCGLPIGNPGDLSPRVLKTLAAADIIAAEDTRTAGIFLRRHQLSKKIISLYEHNEAARVPQILELLRAGKNIAVISEAGMPLISDPGYQLVKAAREANVAIDVAPGPTALITALAASGLPTDSFIFQGFLPAPEGQRREMLESLRAERRTLIFYEAPHRILDTLQDAALILPERLCFLGRELTKKYQEHLRGTAREILSRLKTPRGEFVLIISGATGGEELPPAVWRLAAELKQLKLPTAQAAQIIAEVFALPKNRVKKILYADTAFR
ncbi:MAG: 16S rRNA (cytidine(1402)-2'-O)-methyltransferase [Candidatus Margulisbacteria bacterium]|jgi:16S rRNA (cytidine1402-2'-O)-methyltransferase|nr:16S rRNA (cytidine(1402)-2'-O)-methyltransferase [Candidatus Margulisiibacteriota bacterium]